MSAFSSSAAALRQFARPENLPGTLAGAGVLLAAAAILLPWFAVADVVNGKGDPALEFGLSAWVAHNADGTSRVVPYETAPCGCQAVASSLGLVQVLAWTAALLGAAALAGRAWARLPARACMSLTALAGGLALLGPLLLASTLPGAFLADHNQLNHVLPDGRWGSSFWGSNSINVIRTVAWSPGAAWFVSLLAAGLLLGSLRLKRKEPVATPVGEPAPSRARSSAAGSPSGNGAARPEGTAGQNAFVVPPP